MTRVSVVIPARNAAASLPATLEAVLSQDGVDEVVVAVGPSDDGTGGVAAATGDDRVVVVDNPSGTTPAALNTAIAAATGDVIVRVDAHAVLPPGYVEHAVELLRSTGAGNVGGRQVPIAERGTAAAIAAAMSSPMGSGGAAYRHQGEVRDVDTVYLGVFDRAALDDVGGYDVTMIRNQDAELNERLRRAGHRVVFSPELAVAYRPRDSFRALASQYFQYGRYRRRTAQLHKGSLRLRQLVPAAVVIILVSTLVVAFTGRPRPFLVVAGAYLVTVLTSAAQVRPGDPFRTAWALAIMHLTWGTGFLLGPPGR